MAYPSTVTTFTTKTTGQTVQAEHVNTLQTEVNAIESALISGGFAHDLEPSITDTFDLGSARRWLTAAIKTLTALNLRLKESPASVEGNNYVEITIAEALSADRTLGVTLGDANRTLAITGNSTINQNVATTGTPQFAQAGVGAAASGGAMLNIAGAFTGVGAGFGLSANPSITVPQDQLGAILNSSGTLIEAGAGTHALLAGIRCLAPTITGGAGAVTNAATVYIDAATSATVTGANHSLWVAAGMSRFDGGLRSTGISSATLSSGNNNNLAPTGLANAVYLDLTPNADGTSTITGITAQESGRVLIIRNLATTGGHVITLSVGDGNSTAANQFAAGGASPVISAGRQTTISYCAAISRWQIGIATV